MHYLTAKSFSILAFPFYDTSSSDQAKQQSHSLVVAAAAFGNDIAHFHPARCGKAMTSIESTVIMQRHSLWAK